jgi:hypothetical protein
MGEWHYRREVVAAAPVGWRRDLTPCRGVRHCGVRPRQEFCYPALERHIADWRANFRIRLLALRIGSASRCVVLTGLAC